MLLDEKLWVSDFSFTSESSLKAVCGGRERSHQHESRYISHLLVTGLFKAGVSVERERKIPCDKSAALGSRKVCLI
jgi:hypothetical protein